MNIVETRNADWNRTVRTADNAIASVIEAGVSNARHRITAIEASYDTVTVTGDLILFGLETLNGGRGYVGPIDGTSASVVNLTANTFTLTGHGLTNADKVVYHNGGGTSITGLTSGTMYFVVGVSGADFQLSLTSGGAAIDISGTQASLGAAQYILRVCKQWFILGEKTLSFSNPLVGGVTVPVCVQLSANTNENGLINMSGYTHA
jgi:hypothetical protein